MSKEHREFRLVSIVNEFEVEEHARFIFPIYTGQTQKLYFSEKCDFMIEKVNNNRVFVYTKERVSPATTDCNWI